MRGNNIVVMCVAAGLIPVPRCAYYCRPSGLFVDTESWFVSALKGGDGFQAFRFSTIVCAIVSLVIGLLVKQYAESVTKNGDFKLHWLRTPTAAAILAPAGVGLILFIAWNLPSRMFQDPEWPPVYFDYPKICFSIVGTIGWFATGLLNDRERAFDKSPIYIKLGILVWCPVAVFVGLVLIAGTIGYGLWIGSAIGESFGCPTTYAWIGACVAVFILALEESLFWPVYFPMTNCASE